MNWATIKTGPTASALVVLMAAWAALATAAAAAEFPEKPLQLVTPYPPGGSHSLHAGIITTAAEPHFGQPMISVIRAGGGGVTGAVHVLRSAPDGYTMLFGDPNLNSLRPQVEDLPFKVDDFVAVARINYSPWVFVVRPDAPFPPTPQGLAEYARQRPDKVVYSSDNVNGPTYVVFELLKQKTGTKMRAVNFGGGGPAVTALLGGNTMAYAGDPSVVGDHIKAGSLKGVCVTDETRWKALADVPTCRESGVEIVYHFWRGVLVPKATPPDRVKKLSDGFAKLVKDEGFLRLINTINSSVAFIGHDEFAQYLKREQKQLKDLYDSLKAQK
ncbi:MAG TPA: tripartite tricarboxylate transporter substrate binding protein [Methylomirabilota bacterium]|jgi:tripartite-type tricarboxylate transporter receptor subunit TctC|nr:tripartite tricarboxylate transporter substrate binding protein [Methylomirabilota bacterium]